MIYLRFVDKYSSEERYESLDKRDILQFNNEEEVWNYYINGYLIASNRFRWELAEEYDLELGAI